MTLTQRLTEYVRACFTGLWIESHEHEDALREIAQLCAQEHWKLATWNVATGLSIAGGATEEMSASDPLAAIRALNTLGSQDSAALLVLVNFHRFLGSAEVVQALVQQISAGKQNRTFVVVLSPLVQIPIELEKLFAVIEHELPTREQLQEIAAGIATDSGEFPQGSDLYRVLDAASGLTRYEAENAFSLSLVRHGKIQPSAVWELKTQMLKKSGLLSLHRGQEKFADLGGLDALKAFCLRAMQRQSADPKLRPKGVLLLSPPSTHVRPMVSFKDSATLHAMPNLRATRCSPSYLLDLLQPGQHLHQGLRVHRLDHVVVKPGFVGAAAVFGLPPPGHGDQDDAITPRLLSDSAARLVAVQLRHADVEQHHVGTELRSHVHALLPVVGRAGVVAHKP